MKPTIGGRITHCILFACLSVCHVPASNSVTESSSKPKIDRKVARVTNN